MRTASSTTCGRAAAAVATVALAVLLLVPAALPGSRGNISVRLNPATNSPDRVQPSVDWNNSSDRLPATFFGLNVRASDPLSANAVQALARSSVASLRFPGGTLADGYDLIHNRIYGLFNQSTVAQTSTAQFVAACRALHCRAILSVPGEINDPAMAAADVRYVEQDLHFRAAYWEIGNEPGRWTHFGFPWSKWTAATQRTVTPDQYAEVVRSYIVAMRAVDPTIQVLGLPGTGLGASGETDWVQATAAINGPQIAGIGIHVYPAAGSAVPTLSGFFASLTDDRALPARIALDRAAVRAGCPTCAPIPLFVTELGSGHDGGAFARYMQGFPEALYISAELIQAMTLGLAGTDLFALESSYEGSWYTLGGVPTPVERLYQQILPHLDSVVVPAVFSGGPAGLFAAIATDANRSSATLLIVNTNTTAPAMVNLSGSGFPSTGPGTLWRWGPANASVVDWNWTVAPAGGYRIAPLTVLLVHQSMPPAPPPPLPTPPSPRHGAAHPPLSPGLPVLPVALPFALGPTGRPSEAVDALFGLAVAGLAAIILGVGVAGASVAAMGVPWPFGSDPWASSSLRPVLIGLRWVRRGTDAMRFGTTVALPRAWAVARSHVVGSLRNAVGSIRYGLAELRFWLHL
jgi:hypothetical protein